MTRRRYRGNWVDAGHPPGPTLCRLLAHHFGRDVDADAEWLDEQATLVLGIVLADAGEGAVTSHLAAVARAEGRRPAAPGTHRMAAAALWHAAKAALVRDAAERARRDPPRPARTTADLGRRLPELLLSAEELAQHRARLAERGEDVD